MNLATLLKKLALGPLLDLGVAGDGLTLPTGIDLAKLLLKINLALTAIYARFPLQSKTIVLEAVDGVYTYYLRKEFAQTSGSAEPIKYLQDSVADPFTGEIARIEHVFDGERCPLPLNDRESPKSLHTPGYDSIEIPAATAGLRYIIEYRALHAELPLDLEDPAEHQIRIPTTLEQALLAHIAGGMYGGNNNAEHMAKSQSWLTRYEAECAFLENQNTVQSSSADTNTKLEQGGWV